MEALALRDSVILATKFGATRVYFETDCQNLLHLWTLRNEQRSSIAAILREIHDLSSSLVSFSLCCASRVCNTVAHALAKQASSECMMVEWHQAPSCVLQCLQADCNQLFE
jgi:hypothetical protein